jgi:ATP-dependent Clp protease ATP-binding subunit ClpC
MFERFTEQSRRALVLAQEESGHLDHAHVGTEHLLLGLRLEERGAAARALESAGITADAVRRQVETLAGRGERPPSGHVPFTPRAKKCLELSLREAMKLGHDFIGTGHLLLGLIGNEDAKAVLILGELGTDLEQLRARAISEIERRPEGREYSPPPRPRRPQLPGAVLNLLDAIDDRLTAIERHLGISRPVAAAGEGPGETDGGPGETDGGPGETDGGPGGARPGNVRPPS